MELSHRKQSCDFVQTLRCLVLPAENVLVGFNVRVDVQDMHAALILTPGQSLNSQNDRNRALTMTVLTMFTEIQMDPVYGITTKESKRDQK